jgi:DNA-binding transcriptional MerR regulator
VATLRIGEVAARLGVSARTLRYYEELGLVAPSGHSRGGARRYDEADVARLARIRELQELLGFDLSEIRTVLFAEDRLEGLRREYRAGVGRRRHLEILREAIAINERLRAIVATKRDRLDRMLAELEEKARWYAERLASLGAEGPEASTSGTERLGSEAVSAQAGGRIG